VERYCTWGPYAAALLSQGLRLPNASAVAVGRGDVAWPLGAALVEVGALPGFMPHGGPRGHAVLAQVHAGRTLGGWLMQAYVPRRWGWLMVVIAVFSAAAAAAVVVLCTSQQAHGRLRGHASSGALPTFACTGVKARVGVGCRTDWR
jgi:hypothetical protein